MYLFGLQLQYFRGIAGEGGKLFGFEKFNLFIGPNNSGKSTLLYFLSEFLNRCEPARNKSIKYQPLDKNLSGNHEPIVAWGVSEARIREILAEQTQDINLAELIFNSVFSSNLDDGVLWVHLQEQQNIGLLGQFRPRFEGGYSEDRTIDFSRKLTRPGETYPNGPDNSARHVLNRIISMVSYKAPKVHLVPAIREITKNDGAYGDYSGRGLIDELARHANPDVSEYQIKKQKFDKIELFLQQVLDEPTARIQVPYERTHVNVIIKDRMLPLSQIGTGIHEVIMLAAACTFVEDSIVCLEEPEIHLHPSLQRRLMRFLSSNTSNQYFIATHSASIIDSVNAVIYEVSSATGSTVFEKVVNSQSRRDALLELGYRASDLLQSNYVIWVEGPSDRIYLNHWIGSVDGSLVEGIDYSIMFYGGRLLAHLNADQEASDELDKFIRICNISRHFCILIDSDKRRPDDEINTTKNRVLREAGERGGFVWVTAGREIENYLSADVLNASLRDLYPDMKNRKKVAQYDNALSFSKASSDKKSTPDKVAIAKQVCTMPADLSELDLNVQVYKLINAIRHANHKETLQK